MNLFEITILNIYLKILSRWKPLTHRHQKIIQVCGDAPPGLLCSQPKLWLDLASLSAFSLACRKRSAARLDWDQVMCLSQLRTLHLVSLRKKLCGCSGRMLRSAVPLNDEMSSNEFRRVWLNLSAECFCIPLHSSCCFHQQWNHQ